MFALQECWRSSSKRKKGTTESMDNDWQVTLHRSLRMGLEFAQLSFTVTKGNSSILVHEQLIRNGTEHADKIGRPEITEPRSFQRGATISCRRILQLRTLCHRHIQTCWLLTMFSQYEPSRLNSAVTDHQQPIGSARSFPQMDERLSSPQLLF